MDGKPPPMNPSHMEWQPPPAPACESLLDCQQRALACYDQIEGMAPQLARLATGGGPLNREAVEMLRSLRDQLGMPLSMPQV